MTNNHDTARCTCPDDGDQYHRVDCGLYAPPGTAVARVDEPTDPSGTPLSRVSTAALAFALGYTATQPVRADRWGGVCAVVEELEGRTIDPRDERTCSDEWEALLGSLPPEIARQLSMLYSMQRAQRWAQTGRRS
jgi:hypothetical protein